jgi:DNA-binding Lrp family transcriptional regulator
MKRRELEVFFELIKNSKKSDRDIAKKLNISQPTVTRVRKKLERTVIKAYTLVPSF